MMIRLHMFPEPTPSSTQQEQAESFMKYGQKRLAKLFYERVVARYPDTKVSAEAQKKLDEIKAK